MDWYEGVIEKPVRDLVRLLRDNGFNTSCSSGHEMTVQCEQVLDGEVQRLHNLLYNNGYRNYNIEVCVYVRDGHVSSHFEIKITNEI